MGLIVRWLVNVLILGCLVVFVMFTLLAVDALINQFL